MKSHLLLLPLSSSSFHSEEEIFFLRMSAADLWGKSHQKV